MSCNRGRKKNKEKTESPMLCNKYRTVQQGYPDKRHRQNLYPERYCPMYHEILYIRSKSGMVQKPVIKPSVSTKEQG